MKRQRTHADWALFLRGQFPERPNVENHAEIELAPPFIKLLLDAIALLFMLASVIPLAGNVAIPNALAPVA